MCSHACSDFSVICQCSWIDSFGTPTPDHNVAIALAVCYDPSSFGEKGSDPFPICEHHAKQKGKYWKLLPLPGQDLAHSHPLVQEDDRYFRIVPDTVGEAIKKSFPNDFLSIIKDLRWSGDHYSFNRWGMYVGVELDGHIHT